MVTLSRRISVVIPAHNEARYIGKCLESVRQAASRVAGEVETIVVLNRCTDTTEAIAKSWGAITVVEDAKNLAKIRNAGARAAAGEILVTIDADSWMSPNLLAEVAARLAGGRTIGGGVFMLPERFSLGILASAALMVPYLLFNPISAGLFWCYRKDFEAIGGFNESMVSVEDVDFATRLKAHGRRQGKRFSTLWKARITTSCRKFDRFGDWHLFRNPRWIWQLWSGRNQQAADRYYYDFDRR